MKVLLINPNSTRYIYGRSPLKIAIFRNPSLSLAVIASSLIHAGHKTKIFDLDLPKAKENILYHTIKEWRPDFIGITGTTPLYNEMLRVCKIIKQINPSITIVAGGHHATVLPEEFLDSRYVDMVVSGEGDYTFLDIVSKKDLGDIRGIYYKQDGKIKHNPDRELIEDLDNLPFPAWHLYDLKRYRNPRMIVKVNPVGPIETSRGCIYNCIYCSKAVFGNKFRPKSPERVVNEMEFMLKSGFREIHVYDDGFSIDLNRAKSICDLIIKRNLKFPWVLFNGIRVNNMDIEFLSCLKKSGCYRIGLGIESGNQSVLDASCKGITLAQIKETVKLIKHSGIETFGFFMIGLPQESLESLKDTINFAKELNLDFYKFSHAVPYPGTPLYEQWEKAGYIKSKDWSKYFFHNPDLSKQTFNHPSLSWDDLNKNYRKAYRKLCFNFPYITKVIKNMLLRGH